MNIPFKIKSACAVLLSPLAFFAAACSDSEIEYDATGIFEATEVTVSAEVSGRVERLDIYEGSEVQASEAIGLIDTTQLHLSKMQLLAANDAINSRMVDADLQTASLKDRISNLKSEYERFSSLLESGAVTGKQVDDLAANIEMLESELRASEKTIESSNKSLSGESRAGYIQIQQINDQINRSILRSPISGRIISKYVERGELAVQGRPLFKVADMERMILRAYLTSDQLSSLKVGDKVGVYSDYGDGNIREYSGVVSWISDKAEFTPKTIYTSNERANLVYAVKVAFENDGYAKIGMYGGIKFR